MRGRTWSFIVDKGLPLLTAVLGVAAAILTIWGVQATNDRDRLASRLDTIEDQRDVLSEDYASAQSELEEVLASRDEWKARAEEAEAKAVDTEATTATTVPSGDAGPVDTEAAGVFRETGPTPVTFASGYGIDLDTRDANWGVSGSGDLDFNGERLSTSGQVALVEAAATYEDCDAQTVLQYDLSAEQTVVGRKFCVETSEQRWAYVEVLGLDTERETITLSAKVYSLATN